MIFVCATTKEDVEEMVYLILGVSVRLGDHAVVFVISAVPKMSVLIFMKETLS